MNICVKRLPYRRLLQQNISGQYVRSYTISLAHQRYFSANSSNENPQKSEKKQRTNSSNENPQKSEKNQRTIPPLMDFPEVLWPSAFKSIKNWILVQFIIRPYFDRDFSLKDFIFGAKRALTVISSRLGTGEFQTLQNLISDDAVKELQPIIQHLSVSQRKQLEISEHDIYLTFPYQVGIMFDETNDKLQKRWVEITMVFHVLRGLKEMRERGEEIPWNMGTLPEYQDKVFVCNYRFIKEFTQGHQSDWVVNVVNHFKPIDLVREYE